MASLVPKASPKSGAEIEKMALGIIRKFQPHILGKPQSFDIEAFFELDLERITGVCPDYRVLPPGMYGYTDINDMVVVIDRQLAESNDAGARRFRRSTQGHETGHVIMHVPEFRQRKAILRFIHDDDQAKASLRLFRQENIPVYCNPEWQAWRFAKALLMPDMNVRAALREGYSKIELPEVFDVHPAFVYARLKDLRLSIN
jgi:Zn-dependent peptidase ImmA (M78 family)